MKRLLILFGILDAILFLRFFGRLLTVAHAILTVWSALAGTDSTLLLLFLLSLPFSAYGLVRGRRWAFVLSYIQFPCRFLFVLLSFGFVTVLSKLLDMPALYQPIVYVAMGLEAARLVATIAAHCG